MFPYTAKVYLLYSTFLMSYKLKQTYFAVEYGPHADIEFSFQLSSSEVVFFSVNPLIWEPSSQ